MGLAAQIGLGMDFEEIWAKGSAKDSMGMTWEMLWGNWPECLLDGH